MIKINLFSVKQVFVKSQMYDLDNSRIKIPLDAYLIIQKIFDLQNSPVEKFGIITFNSKMDLAGIHLISIGTVDSTVVHSRDIYQAAILNNASSLLLFHNHPSGDPVPSEADIVITKQILLVGEIMGITMLDHIIIGNNKFCSLREEKYI